MAPFGDADDTTRVSGPCDHAWPNPPPSTAHTPPAECGYPHQQMQAILQAVQWVTGQLHHAGPSRHQAPATIQQGARATALRQELPSPKQRRTHLPTRQILRFLEFRNQTRIPLTQPLSLGTRGTWALRALNALPGFTRSWARPGRGLPYSSHQWQDGGNSTVGSCKITP